MEIYVVRHGHSPSTAEAKVKTDAERPLSEQGEKDIAKIAGYLQKSSVQLQAIFTSPLLRAVETAVLLASVLNPASGIKKLPALSGQSSPSDLWRALERTLGNTPSAPIALVGHYPQVGKFVTWLTKNHAPSFLPGTCVALEHQKNKTQLLWSRDP